jgi:hypothetical protein
MRAQRPGGAGDTAPPGITGPWPLPWALGGGGTIAWVPALLAQASGRVAERWFLSAQARHPQNLYDPFIP